MGEPKDATMHTTHSMREALRSGNSQQRLKAAQLVLQNLEEWLPWLSGRRLVGLNITARDDGWLLVLKATRKGIPEVAFIGGDSLEDCLVDTAHGLLFAFIQWKPDKFRSMRSVRQR